MSVKRLFFQMFIRPFLSEAHTMPGPEAFLSEPLDVMANETKIIISKVLPVEAKTGSILISFERKDSTPMFSLEIEASPDQGKTWAFFQKVDIPEHKTRVIVQVNFAGLTHLRLSRIINSGDALHGLNALLFF